jgi:hypothetical protein
MLQHNSPQLSNKQLLSKLILPFVLVIVMLSLKRFPAIIENYYSTGIYIKISNFLRIITGWANISIGDVLYAVIAIQILIRVIKIIRFWFKKQTSWYNFRIGFVVFIKRLLWIYVVFNFLWGLNYNRLGIAYQLHIEPKSYSKDDVENLVCDLVDKLNERRRKIGRDSLPFFSYQQIFKITDSAYDDATKNYPFLKHQYSSAKKSLFTGISHYVGFTGYYNPFSGEAQVSTDLPNILLPYISTHEIAHQLGYASEGEANFVGYLAGGKSDDIYLNYSVYMDLYKYAATELFLKDFTTSHSWELDSLVRKDFTDIRKFFNKKSNNLAPYMSGLYNQYLLANQQIKGIESYNDVVAFLIAYKKKYGKI